MFYNKLIIFLIVIVLPISVIAQTKREAVEELKQQMLQLKTESETKFEKLENELKQILTKIQKTEQEDAMRQLLEKARKLSQNKKSDASDATKKFHSGLRQQSALNPNISLAGDYYFVYATSDEEYNRIPSEYSWGTGKLFLREMEMGFQAALDPYSRGKVYISYGQEGVAIEEGYIELLNLPLNMNLKMGEYKTQFGKLNRFHDHALPQFERPRVLINFFGLTSLKGFGASANFLLPSITAHVNELDLEVITGGVDHSFTSGGKHNLVYVGHFKNYYDLNRATYLEIGFSGATGYNDLQEQNRTIVGGADVTVKWSPPGRAKYRGIEWRSEILFSDRQEIDNNIRAWGCYSSLQMKFGAKWFGSGRLDYSQLPYDKNLVEKGFAVCIDYWQSEFVFFRMQYSRISRNFLEGDNQFIFQTNWAMGPHKHEAY